MSDPKPGTAGDCPSSGEKERWQKSRAGIMGVITRAGNSLQEWLESDSVPVIKGRLSSIESSVNQFRTVTNQLLEFIDASQVETYFIENMEKESSAQVVIESLRARLGELEPSVNTSNSSPSTPLASSSAHMRLDVLKMDKFDGSPIKFQSFWDRWEARYHNNPNISDVDRFEYLVLHLEGVALTAVSGLPPTANNYQHALDIIKRRFGKRTPRIISHVMAILDLPKGGDKSSGEHLRKILDVIVPNIRSLKSMGLFHSSSGDINAVLGSILFSRFPDSVCQKWCEHHGDEDAIDVNSFVAFVEKHVEGLEMALLSRGPSASVNTQSHANVKKNSFSPLSAGKMPSSHYPRQLTSLHANLQSNSNSFQKNKPKPHSFKPSSSSSNSFSLLPGTSGSPSSSNSNPRPPCPFCAGDHYIGRCEKAKSLPSATVISTLEKSSRCLCCFRYGHKAKDCDFKPTCILCQGVHLPLVCSKRFTPPSPSVTSTLCSFQNSEPRKVFLQTMAACAVGPFGSERVRCLLDTGSETSFILESLAHRLGLVPSAKPHVSVESFGSSFISNAPTNLYPVTLRSLYDPNVSFQMDMLGTQSITRKEHRFPDSSDLNSMPHLKNISFSDDSSFASPIEILIGADYYYGIVGQEIRRGEPTAMSSSFGWILSGPAPALDEDESGSKSVHLINCHPPVDEKEENLDRLLSDFFSIDSYSMEKQDDSQCSTVLEQFSNSIVYTGSRYEVSLPWKPQHPPLITTAFQARRRLDNLLKRLERDPLLFDRYKIALQEFLDRKFIEPVPSEKSPYSVYYLPHRPVVRESAKTTKVRPVFDASCKGPTGISLNSCLETGPSLNPEIIDILLRFRHSPYAISSDIQKAFLQLELSPRDRDVCRFLWLDKDGNPTTYRFRVVTFGLVSSPFLLRATISHHLSLYSSSEVASEMEKNFYVDNLFQTGISVHELLQKAEMAHTIMSEAGMSLCQ